MSFAIECSLTQIRQFYTDTNVQFERVKEVFCINGTSSYSRAYGGVVGQAYRYLIKKEEELQLKAQRSFYFLKQDIDFAEKTLKRNIEQLELLKKRHVDVDKEIAQKEKTLEKYKAERDKLFEKKKQNELPMSDFNERSDEERRAFLRARQAVEEQLKQATATYNANKGELFVLNGKKSRLVDKIVYLQELNKTLGGFLKTMKKREEEIAVYVRACSAKKEELKEMLGELSKLYKTTEEKVSEGLKKAERAIQVVQKIDKNLSMASNTEPSDKKLIRIKNAAVLSAFAYAIQEKKKHMEDSAEKLDYSADIFSSYMKDNVSELGVKNSKKIAQTVRAEADEISKTADCFHQAAFWLQEYGQL